MQIFQPDRFLLAQFVQDNAFRLKGDVLDVGGGDDHRYQGFLKEADRYRSLDSNASARPDIVASVENLPLPDSSIDSVLCMEVFMDVLNPRVAMSEIARVLKSGGALVLSTPFMIAILKNDLWRFTHNGLSLLLQADFHAIHIKQRAGYHTVRLQNLLRYCIDRWSLYEHRWLGGAFSVLGRALWYCVDWRDRHDHSPSSHLFTLGYSVTAVRND